jgi:hypothetical protein
VALYHLSVKTVSRSTGRSAVAAAAYRSGERLTNERDGQTHDFTRRSGVVSSFVVAPAGAEGWAQDRATLWNRAETAENRKNSTVAREYELALPAELDAQGREQLAREFAGAVVARFGVVADVAIHAPGREGDNRNHHAHVLTTTRAVDGQGFGAKTRALDDQKSGAIEEIRALWAGQVNQALERAGRGERIDHRSHARQDAARGQDARDRASAPGVHLGPAATAIERQAVRNRVRGLPENATTMQRHRAGRFQGDSRRGAYDQERKADHLAIATARHAVREAESDHKALVTTAAELEQARQAKAEAARQKPDQFRERVQAAARKAQEAKAVKSPATPEQPQRAPEAPQEADLRRWRGMSSDQLAREMEALRPRGTAQEWAEARPEVRKLREEEKAALDAGKQAADRAWKAAEGVRVADLDIKEIRSYPGISNRFSVWVHDRGWYRQPGLIQAEKAKEDAQKRQVGVVGEVKAHQAAAAEANKRAEAALEKILPGIQVEHKAAQERAERAMGVFRERLAQEARSRPRERTRSREQDRGHDLGR